MEKIFAPAALGLLLLSFAGCAPAPACRPVADSQPIAVPAPAPAPMPVQAAPAPPPAAAAPVPAEPGYYHASGGAFY